VRIKRPNREHFITEFTADTFAFLANLLQFNLDSRRFVVDAMTGGLYGPLERREGQFEGIEPLARQRLLSLITLAILSTVYMALEDLGKILRLHKEPLREFPNRFVRLTQESSLSAFQELSTVPERSLLNVFPLWKPEWYGIGGQEATALNDYNIRVARITKQFLAFLADFHRRHNLAYNRYKHGMAIFTSLQGQRPAEGIDGLAAIARDVNQTVRNVGFILVGRKVIERLKGLLNSVVGFAKVLVERRLQMAEFGGTPLPLLCSSTETDGRAAYVPRTVFGGDEEPPEVLISIFRTTLDRLDWVKITVNLDAEVKEATLNEAVEFYARGWPGRGGSE